MDVRRRRLSRRSWTKEWALLNGGILIGFMFAQCIIVLPNIPSPTESQLLVNSPGAPNSSTGTSSQQIVSKSLERRDDSVHLFEYDVERSWRPEPGYYELGDVDESFFDESRREVHTDLSKPRTDFLGFIRISKTGSTSMLNFLNMADENLYSSDGLIEYYDFASYLENNNGEHWWDKNVLRCAYVRSTEVELEVVDLNPIDVCPHFSYTQLLSLWSSALPFMDNPKEKNIQVSFQSFTIIRDPFERLVSYFYYYRDTYPHWKAAATEAQHEKLMGNDLEGWMQLLYEEDGSKVFDIPYQYVFLAEDADDAIRLIQGDSPRILTLVNDCFDTSVRLLVDKKPQFFTPGVVDSFLNSTASAANLRRDKSGKGKALGILRAKAMEWFEEDFSVYYAAVQQFQRHMASSSLDPREIDLCNQKLSIKLVYPKHLLSNGRPRPRDG